MAYELWDRESANVVGEYDTEDEALAFIHRMVQAHGPDVVLPWALVYEDEAEETHSIANGPDLLHRAHEAVQA
jgi:hypothetical protein